MASSPSPLASQNDRLLPRFLWSLLLPGTADRAEPTVSGVVLFLLCLGVGMAAYNSANNILFITLSLLLGSLVLSGVLSWLNLRKVHIGLQLAFPYRAGEPATIELVLENRKRLLPSHNLWCNLVIEPVSGPRPDASPKSLWESLKAAARSNPEREVARVPLGRGLMAGETRLLVWSWTPPHRGRWRIRLDSVGSLFPFGFLRKHVSLMLSEELLVWPAPLSLDAPTSAATGSTQSGRRTTRKGEGGDLLALRPYEPGDSHRLIHWKASARQRQLMTRQCAAESHEAYVLHFDSDASLWPESASFETAVRLAATLAEQLQAASRLRRLSIDGETPVSVRRFSDLENWMDRMACIMPSQDSGLPALDQRGRGIIRIRAHGPRGAAAYVDGRQLSTA